MDQRPALTREAVGFESVVAQCGEGILVCTADGTVLEANQAFCDLVRRPRPQVVGHPVLEFLEPRDRTPLAGRIERLVGGPVRSLQRDVRLVTGRGHTLWGALVVSVIVREPGPDGVEPPPLLCFMVRDISDAKQLETMLLESERRHRMIFSSLSEGFVQVDVSGRVVEVNDALCRMLGMGRETLIGRPLTQVLTAEGCATLAVELDGGGAINHRFGLTFRHADGREVLADVYPAGLGNQQAAGGGFIAVVVDVTERSLAERALAASEERYRTLVDSMQDGLILVRAGRFEFVNEAAARIVGLTAADLTGKPFIDFVDEDDRVLVMARYNGRLRGEQIPNEYVLRLRRSDGSPAVVNIHTALVQAPDGDRLHIATVKDVTERERIAAQLRILSSALDQSAAAVIITDARGAIVYVNDRFTKLTGWTAAEVAGSGVSVLAERPDDPEADGMADAIRLGRAWKGETRARRKTGESYWAFVSIAPVRDDAGVITHYVAVKEDITNRKESEHKVWQQAHFDSVTGLPNRVLFQDRLAQGITRSRRGDGRLCLMFIDLDRFKIVNDTLGHEAGDELLCQVAGRLLECVRESDTVARLAGDEFTILLPDPGGEKDISTVAGRVLEALRTRFVLSGDREVFIGGSIGVAIFPEDGGEAAELLKNADTAMYRAKENGRNTFQFFTAEMNADAAARMALETDLRRALEAGELVVHFQPVVDGDARRVTGAEALVRWNHPTRGLLPPGAFLPVAEEIGLIQEIGERVLREACVEAARWRAAGHEGLIVSVNIADRQVTTGRLHHVIAEVLGATGLPPESLYLEVGESLILREVPVVEEVLTGISEQGVGLAIDDFGTGYASLRHLRRYPFRILKLDRSFIRDMLENAEDQLLTETVIAMARKLGLSVIAEGVETTEQLEWLLGQFCDHFQGYLFGRPLPAEEFRPLLGRSLEEVEAAIG